MKKVINSLGIFILLGLLFTCNLDTAKTGSIVLSFPMLQNKTLLPSISMEPASYEITGDGPGSKSFALTSEQPQMSVTSLAFGTWDVAVNAKNVDGTIIGQGFGTTIVHVGETSIMNIIVTPLDGIGTLDLTMNWNVEDTDYPTIQSQLLPPTGTPIDLGFTITGGNTGTYANSAISTGYYSLVVKLMDGNPLNTTPQLTMGAVEVVRIVKDQTTAGVFDFTKINIKTGTIQVNITPEMANPIDVTLDGQQAMMAVDGSMTVTASVPSEVGNVMYVWYINGDAVATGSDYTISGLALGVYRLDVTAFTVDGLRAGSATHQFDVVEELPTAEPTLDPTPVPPASWSLIEIPNLPVDSYIVGLWTKEIGNLYVGAQRYANTANSEIYIYHYNNNSWNIDIQLSGSYNFGDLFGTANNDIFFHCRNANTNKSEMYHFNGIAWEQKTIPTELENEGISNIVGEANNLYVSSNCKIYRYNGNSWEYITTGRGGFLIYISANEIYQMDCWGHTLWDGNTWSWYGGFDFCDIGRGWGMRDENNVLHMYVIGGNNFGNGVRVWKFVEYSTGSMVGTWGSKYDCTYLCDPSGSGSAWAGSGHSIWGSGPNDIYAVGHHGWSVPYNSGIFTERIYHYSGTVPFTRMTNFDDMPIDLTAQTCVLLVNGTGADDVWISAGDSLLHYGWN